MSVSLPPEIWELILAKGGPLEFSEYIGAYTDRIAALRIQRAWRSIVHIPITLGCTVLVRFPGPMGLRTGVVCQWQEGDGSNCVRLKGRKAAFIFLPHPTVRIRAIR